nr:protein translation factor SUI1 homolog [Ipomoea batatas]
MSNKNEKEHICKLQLASINRWAFHTSFLSQPYPDLGSAPSSLSSISPSPPHPTSRSDPFAEANAENSGAGSKDYVHIRVQQRNGRKSLTTVQGLKKEFSYNKILKDLKKEFCCNGTVVQDPELGQVH